jgi:signal transduction histidine kinase/CheY-like chemotaxis protein
MRPLRVLMTAAIVGPLLLFAAASTYEYRRVLGDAEQLAVNSASVLYEHALKVFETQVVVIDLIEQRVRDFTDAQIRAHEAELHRYLKEVAEPHEQINALWLFDEAGNGIASTRLYPVPASFSIADRDYYKAHQLPNSGLYVDKIVRGRASGDATFSVSRRRKLADGSAGSIILAAVYPKYFQDFYASVVPDLDATINLVRADGAILVRTPALPDDTARLAPDSPLLWAGARADRGRYDAVSPFDGTTRLYSYRKLPKLPLYVVFGVGKQAVLVEWYRNAAIYGLLALLASIGLVTVTRLAMRRAHAEQLAVVRWQDAAERAEGEMQRRIAAEAALRQAQKMEAIGQMTGGIAHDFNNLLMVVVGNLEMLAQQADRPEIVRQFAASALKAARRGGKLTVQLLAFGRRQMLQPEIIDPNHLIKDFTPLIRQAAGEMIEIRTILAPEIGYCRIDPAQFQASVLNLVLNGRDAMPRGGRITVETKNIAISAAETQGDPEFAAGSYVLVLISDTGIGMSADVLDKAFEPFFTTKEVGKGSGLGLSQVYGFAKQSGGHVRIESELGIGTTVKLYFPRSLERGANQPTIERKRTIASSAARTILLTEDSPEVLDTVAAMLRHLGYDAVTAKNAAEALAVLRSDRPIDALVTDVLMPGGMNGDELAREALRLRPGVRVLLTTGYAAQFAGEMPVITDDLPMIRKPYDRDDLAAKLKEIFATAA